MPLDVGTAVPASSLSARAPTGSAGDTPKVLFFFKSTCPTCAITFPYVDAMDRAFGNDHVEVLGVSQEHATIADEFGGRCGVNVALLDDSSLETSRAFDVQNVPTTYLVDGAGQVQDVVIGLDKAGLNRVASTLADWTGSAATVIAPEDDGNPPMQPG